MTFGERLRRLRKEKKLSQTQLGERCGLSLRTIRNYEKEGRYPKQRQIYQKLAEALDCPVHLLLWEDAPSPMTEDCVTASALLTLARLFFLDEERDGQEKDALMQSLLALYRESRETDGAQGIEEEP